MVALLPFTVVLFHFFEEASLIGFEWTSLSHWVSVRDVHVHQIITIIIGGSHESGPWGWRFL